MAASKSPSVSARPAVVESSTTRAIRFTSVFIAGFVDVGAHCS